MPNSLTPLQIRGPGQFQRPAYSPHAMLVAVTLWFDVTSDPDSPRRCDLIRDKKRILLDYFGHSQKTSEAITELDVKAWQAEREKHELSQATV